MKYNIAVTPDNTKSWPIHKHPFYEIMHYTEGVGVLHTSNGDIPFKKDTIIVVPPNVLHGSKSESGFKNISIGGDFAHKLSFKSIFTTKDNSENEGSVIANLIINHQHENNELLYSLIETYIIFLLENVHPKNAVLSAVEKIKSDAHKMYTESSYNITDSLNQTGYSEDYIRNEFKKYTGITPIEYLNRYRINTAERYIKIYKDSLSIKELAFMCGFNDPIYFSKLLKKYIGVSPKKYK